MSFWQRMLSRPGDAAHPTSIETLTAHIDALEERSQDAAHAARPAGRKALEVLPASPRLLVAVEAGLSRVEIVVATQGLHVKLLPDALFPGVVEWGATERSVLRELEFVRDGSGCHVCVWESARGSNRRLAEHVERLLHEVLQLPRGDFYSVALEAERVPDNSELIISIERLVKVQDFEARRLVYQAFLNAQVFVPLTVPEELDAPASVRPWQRGGLVDKGEDWAVFSDESALVRAKLGQVPVALVSGIRIARVAEAQGIAALKLNPGSRVGGEFLRNELWMMCDYLRKLGVK